MQRVIQALGMNGKLLEEGHTLTHWYLQDSGVHLTHPPVRRHMQANTRIKHPG